MVENDLSSISGFWLVSLIFKASLHAVMVIVMNIAYGIINDRRNIEADPHRFLSGKVVFTSRSVHVL